MLKSKRPTAYQLADRGHPEDHCKIYTGKIKTRINGDNQSEEYRDSIVMVRRQLEETYPNAKKNADGTYEVK